MKACLPGVRQTKSADIVHISSSQGLGPSLANGIYVASKAALEAVGDSLSQEVTSLGIRVFIDESGAYKTNFGGGQATATKSSPASADLENIVSKRLDLVA